MHPATEQILRYFTYDHLPERLQDVSRPLHDLAQRMAQTLPEGPEVTAGLRKLLEAKDCFVRAALELVLAPLWDEAAHRERPANCPNRIDVTPYPGHEREYVCGCRPGDQTERG